jgi:hypothetical protein
MREIFGDTSGWANCLANPNASPFTPLAEQIYRDIRQRQRTYRHDQLCVGGVSEFASH